MNLSTTQSAPIVQDRARISKIWLVPLIAALIGASLLIEHWQNQGTAIQISFDTAEGLAPGKTKVKYRSVDIGVVESVSFNSDQSKIKVQVVIDKEVSSLLRRDTLFWVVRPRIGASGVTGFDTLLSGAYLEISPGSSDQRSSRYVGLESPPITSPSTPGIRVSLTSFGGKSLNVGNPVMYKGFQVGRVEQVEFDTDTRGTNYNIFIDAPYDSLVTTNTYFWNVGGASVSTSAAGVSIDIASIETLVAGGLEFGVPDGFSLGEPVANHHSFALFESKAAVLEGKKYQFIEYVVLVNRSVGGLNKGASVEFKGIRIGTVQRVEFAFTQLAKNLNDEKESHVPVLIRMEPERVVPSNELNFDEFKAQVDNWILNGLTATLETSNFLTGGLKVHLDSSGKGIKDLDQFNGITVIPYGNGKLANVTDKVESILDTMDGFLGKVEDLPIATTVDELNTALSSANETLVSLRTTLDESQVTLQSIRPQADLFESFRGAMTEFERTLDKMQPLLQELSNKPNALIFSGKKPADQEPKAKK